MVWLISPTIDLFFICGGALIAFAVLHSISAVLSLHHQTQYFFDAAILFAFLLGETHTVSSFFILDADRSGRLGSGKPGRQKFSACHKFASGLSLLLFALICIRHDLAPWAVRLYLLSVSWHFIAQARGIAWLYCLKSGYAITSAQKRLWHWLLSLSMANWMLVQLSTYLGDKEQLFLNQHLPVLDVVPGPLIDVMNILIVGLLFAVIGNICWRAKRNLPLPPIAATILLVVVVVIFLPANPIARMHPSIWLYAPALFHGSQYLCVVALRLMQGSGDQNHILMLARKYAASLAIAALLFIASPWILAQLFSAWGLNYGVALAAVFVAAQLYHMMLDAVIWKKFRVR